MEPPKGSKGQAGGILTVWVCQQEKVVSGMTRRTTCADVVRALLAEQRRNNNNNNSNNSGSGSSSKTLGTTGCGGKSLMGHPDAYGVVEKWRGYERVLPGRTKLLRLWTAWGAERSWVRFVLVKKDAFVQGAALRAAEARLVQSKVKPQPPPRSTAKFIEALSPELQRRIVRKAFRKLSALNGVKEEEDDEDEDDAEDDDVDDAEDVDDENEPVAAEIEKKEVRQKRNKQQHKQGDETDELGEHEKEMTRRMKRARRMRRGLESRQCAPSPPLPAFAQRLETLVHVVISQDHTVRQQTQRLCQLDAEIEEYEARTHSDRVRKDGANYVHDAYALGCGHEHAAAAASGGGMEGEGDGGGGGGGDFDSCPWEDFEEYARVCGEVLSLHEQLRARENAIERLSLELERNRRTTRGSRAASARDSPIANEEVEEEATAAAAYKLSPDADETTADSHRVDFEAAERLKSELGACAYVGFRMDVEAQAAAGELARSERTLQTMQREFERLVKNIERMGVQQQLGQEEQDVGCASTTSTHRTQVPPSRCPPLHVAVGGKEFASGDGDDSDTGLSSMHSQDSDTVVALESLV